MGIEFPAPGERLGRLEEAVQVCLQTWSGDDGPFRGRYYDLAETMCSPPAITRPHPPVMIGGGGEQRTLRIVAQYADIWNIASFPVDAIQHKLDVLRAHGDAVGRDTDAIRKTILWMDDPARRRGRIPPRPRRLRRPRLRHRVRHAVRRRPPRRRRLARRGDEWQGFDGEEDIDGRG